MAFFSGFLKLSTSCVRGSNIFLVCLQWHSNGGVCKSASSRQWQQGFSLHAVYASGGVAALSVCACVPEVWWGMHVPVRMGKRHLCVHTFASGGNLHLFWVLSLPSLEYLANTSFILASVFFSLQNKLWVFVWKVLQRDWKKMRSFWKFLLCYSILGLPG